MLPGPIVKDLTRPAAVHAPGRQGGALDDVTRREGLVPLRSHSRPAAVGQIEARPGAVLLCWRALRSWSRGGRARDLADVFAVVAVGIGPAGVLVELVRRVLLHGAPRADEAPTDEPCSHDRVESRSRGEGARPGEGALVTCRSRTTAERAQGRVDDGTPQLLRIALPPTRTLHRPSLGAEARRSWRPAAVRTVRRPRWRRS